MCAARLPGLFPRIIFESRPGLLRLPLSGMMPVVMLDGLGNLFRGEFGLGWDVQDVFGNVYRSLGLFHGIPPSGE
jgi:hypothetical protein